MANDNELITGQETEAGTGTIDQENVTPGTTDTGTDSADALGTEYKLAYFFIKERGGHVHRLNIYKKSLPETLVIAKYLPYVQAWSLGYTGSEGVLSPIIKTQCNITLVDAPDNVETVTIDGVTYQCKTGDYEGFYTSDSTAWKVVITEDGRTRWTGYITPDSFSESLSYHSSVSITARDNIGHLQDMDFDIAGDSYNMVKVKDIIDGALSKVGAMSMDWSVTPNLFGRNNTNSAEAVELRVPSSGFKDKNLFEALRDVLEGLGLVMRWNENNAFVLSDIGSLPDLFAGSFAVPETPVQFAGRSGMRELDPAYKRVIEKFNFETGDLLNADLSESDYQDTATSATINGQNVSGYLPKASTGWARYSSNFILLNPFKYNRNPYFGTQTKIDSNIFVPVFKSSNAPINSYLYKVMPITYGNATLKLKYSFDSCLYYGNDSTGYMNTAIGAVSGSVYAVSYWGASVTLSSGVKQSYNAKKGVWQSSTVQNTAIIQAGEVSGEGSTSNISVECNIPIPSGATRIEFRIYPTTVDGIPSTLTFFPDNVNLSGMLDAGKVYACISDYAVEVANIGDYDYNKVTTIYDDRNNVTYNREPKYGQVPQLSTPNAIKNGFYIATDSAGIYPAAVNWRYLTGYNTGMQDLAVWVHQQILTQFYKPMDILTGTLIVSDARLTSVFTWKNKKYLLTSGEINLLDGMIEGAHLREVHSFAEVFDPVEDSRSGGGSVDPEELTLSTTSVTVNGKVSGMARVTVTASSSTAWSVTAPDDWITVTPTSGTGSGNIRIDVSEVGEGVTRTSRTGYVYVNNQVITVTQKWTLSSGGTDSGSDSGSGSTGSGGAVPGEGLPEE